MPDSDKYEIDPRLIQVRGEYLEVPGLQLTVAQASRLWDLKPATTVRLLNLLVDSRFLRREGDCYVRADCGRVCA
jgi:hypothetical protein